MGKTYRHDFIGKEGSKSTASDSGSEYVHVKGNFMERMLDEARIRRVDKIKDIISSSPVASSLYNKLSSIKSAIAAYDIRFKDIANSVSAYIPDIENYILKDNNQKAKDTVLGYIEIIKGINSGDIKRKDGSIPTNIEKFTMIGNVLHNIYYYINDNIGGFYSEYSQPKVDSVLKSVNAKIAIADMYNKAVSKLEKEKLLILDELRKEIDKGSNDISDNEYLEGFKERSSARLSTIYNVVISNTLVKDILGYIEDDLAKLSENTEDDNEINRLVDRLESYKSDNSRDLVNRYINSIADEYYSSCHDEYDSILDDNGRSKSLSDRQKDLDAKAIKDNDTTLKYIAKVFNDEQKEFAVVLANKKVEVQKLIPDVSIEKLDEINKKLADKKKVLEDAKVKISKVLDSEYSSSHDNEADSNFIGKIKNNLIYGATGWRNILDSDADGIVPEMMPLSIISKIKNNKITMLYIFDSSNVDSSFDKAVHKAAKTHDVVIPKVDIKDSISMVDLLRAGIKKPGFYVYRYGIPQPEFSDNKDNISLILSTYGKEANKWQK